MVAALNGMGAVLLGTAALFSLAQGSCQFNKTWEGSWFQSGMRDLVNITSNYFHTKGECLEESGDKYMLYERNEDCYRCMVIHQKHPSVLQYKETFCEHKTSLKEMCYRIGGDAQLNSMFRVYPEVKPILCPFRGAPFTFSYNRGSGDCSNPPSKAEVCTDDARLVLKYQACPDVPSTESNVEELVCLATWNEGSSRYLMGKISQGTRRSAAASRENQYRCFVYVRHALEGHIVYKVAQSGDATCNGLQTVEDGSRTMTLTTVDNHHNKCKFPSWITDHHTWSTLDDRKTYRFNLRNATLNVIHNNNNNVEGTDTAGPISSLFPQQQQKSVPPYGSVHDASRKWQSSPNDQRNTGRARVSSEMRVVCHSILESVNDRRVRLVAHVMAGCNSGYVCMVFHKRDTNVIEVQQSDSMEIADEACAHFNTNAAPYTTLITSVLHQKKCPHVGQYTIANNEGQYGSDDRRRRRKRRGLHAYDTTVDDTMMGTKSRNHHHLQQLSPMDDCPTPDVYDVLSIGCNAMHQMEFRSVCAQQSLDAYSCHGSWEENGMTYVIASPVVRRSSQAARYCFMYRLGNTLSSHDAAAGRSSDSSTLTGGAGNERSSAVVDATVSILRVSSVTDSCHRHIEPGLTGQWASNFSGLGICTMDGMSAGSFARPAFMVTYAITPLLHIAAWLFILYNTR